MPATPPPNAVKLYDEVQKLKLNVATIAPIHGRGAVPIAELRKVIGRKYVRVGRVLREDPLHCRV